jgi:hypothetical protein
LVGLTVASVIAPANLSSQASATQTNSNIARPFSVGEELTYKVRFGRIPVGTARMSVAGIEEVRGHPTFHLVFTIDGGLPFFSVHDRYESWIDTLTLASRRHVQEIREGRYKRNRRYEIFPEERMYRENDDTLKASVDSPLDEGSFIYFIRTVRVPVGQTREFNQYFKPDRNPVIIRALRRDTVEVPSGRYPTVVVRPSIRANGIFAEDGQAELWISDDAKRMLVKMESKFAGFSLSLSLIDVRRGS